MDKKTYQKIIKKLEKTCGVLQDLMKTNPDDLFEVLITGAPPEGVALIALFSGNMMNRFVKKTVDMVYQFDEECNSEAEICATCDNRDTCPDRKDQIWMQ